jgi:hypothetical protein
VEAAVAELGLGKEWIGKGNREVARAALRSWPSTS